MMKEEPSLPRNSFFPRVISRLGALPLPLPRGGLALRGEAVQVIDVPQELMNVDESFHVMIHFVEDYHHLVSRAVIFADVCGQIQSLHITNE